MAEGKEMRSDRIDVAYVARLARIHLSEDEQKMFQEQLEQVLGHVRKINKLDLSGVEPTYHTQTMTNVFRKDVSRPGLDREAVLSNAPAEANDQFSVPKIVE